KFPHWIAENKISHCFLPTPLGEIFLTHVEPKHPSLKFLLLGGDKLKPLKRIMNFFVVNHYGPSESSVVTTYGYVDSISVDPPIGISISAITARIERQEADFNSLATGELLIGGAGLAWGYL